MARPTSDEAFSDVRDDGVALHGTGRAPVLRAANVRWLLATALSGVLATGFAGALLEAAVGHTRPHSPLETRTEGLLPRVARVGDRPLIVAAPPPPRERVIRVSTVTRDGDRRIVRRRPFGYAAAPLAVAPPAQEYARFDPLAVYSATRTDRLDPVHAAIYGADVESEVTLTRRPFDGGETFHASTATRNAVLAEVAGVRTRLENADRAFARLQRKGSGKESLGGAVAAIESLAGEPLARPASAPSLAYAPEVRSLNRLSLASIADDAAVAPSEADGMDAGLGTAALTAALTLGAQNVSSVRQSIAGAWAAPMSREAVLTLETNESLKGALASALRSQGAKRDFALAAARGLESLWGERADEPGRILVRIAWRGPADDAQAREREVRRVSLYEADTHLLTLARSDEGAVVAAPAPAVIEIDADTRRKRRIALARAMPTVYDGLMRAALSQGMTPEHAHRLVRIMAFDLDFRAKASPEDRLELFFSLAEGERKPTAESQILYAAATIGGVTRRYYRYATSDGKNGTVTDFYAADGRSAKKFLLREPVPNGRFTSGYGMRRHPISRYRKMHTGVDWAAPSGTPILAAGAGTVIKAGWAGGYGRQVKIRHANGYVTSYSHLRRYARGIKKGAKVRQGQRIGQVGTSGASTGPHLHYEVLVNNRRVNPMRIRVPRGRTLKGERLEAFTRERERIDALVAKARGSVELASR